MSNDDGIFSPGLKSLAEVAAEFGEVRIVAPDVEQSAMGHAITIQKPLHIHATPIGDFEAYRVSGTPADCVALGIYHFGPVDLVVSGINIGYNLGNDIWHSGTVAAAKQASLLGIAAVAFSAHTEAHKDELAQLLSWVRRVLALLINDSAARLVNVNLPTYPKGLLWTRQSVRHYEGRIIPGEDPMGRKHYWFAARPGALPNEGTDRWAVQHELVSLTPLRLDLTDEALIEDAMRRMPVSV